MDDIFRNVNLMKMESTDNKGKGKKLFICESTQMERKEAYENNNIPKFLFILNRNSKTQGNGGS